MNPKKSAKAKPKAKFNVRVRHEPPTLDEAIFAAQGLSDNVREQIEIAATLMGLPEDQVQKRVLEQGAMSRGANRTVLTSSNRAGAQRSVIVERKTPRRIAPARTQPLLTPASFPR